MTPILRAAASRLQGLSWSWSKMDIMSSIRPGWPYSACWIIGFSRTYSWSSITDSSQMSSPPEDRADPRERT